MAYQHPHGRAAPVQFAQVLITFASTPIAAVATASGRGAVGIVRVSGHGLTPLIDALCRRPLAPREATYLKFFAADGSAIDQGLALHFPSPHSYTGEDVLELQAQDRKSVV